MQMKMVPAPRPPRYSCLPDNALRAIWRLCLPLCRGLRICNFAVPTSVERAKMFFLAWPTKPAKGIAWCKGLWDGMHAVMMWFDNHHSVSSGKHVLNKMSWFEALPSSKLNSHQRPPERGRCEMPRLANREASRLAGPASKVSDYAGNREREIRSRTTNGARG